MCILLICDVRTYILAVELFLTYFLYLPSKLLLLIKSIGATSVILAVELLLAVDAQVLRGLDGRPHPPRLRHHHRLKHQV